jgi:hypothetical protein
MELENEISEFEDHDDFTKCASRTSHRDFKTTSTSKRPEFST